MNIQIEEKEIINIENLGWEFVPQDDIDTSVGVFGEYWFNNRIGCTHKVAKFLSKDELAAIIQHAQIMAIKNYGTKYLFVYQNKAKNYKIFFKDSGMHPTRKQYECSTLMFAEEY